MKRLLTIFCLVLLCISFANASSGNSSLSIKWQSQIGSICSSPAVDDNGVIYIGNRSYYFYAINPDDGSVIWEFYTGSVIDSAPTIGPDGAIYFASRNPSDTGYGPQFFALNSNGTLRWKIDGIGGNSSPAIGPDGTIYFSSNPYNYPWYEGTLYAFDPAGNEKWSYPAGGDSSPAIGSDGTIYLSSNGKLYALNPNGSKKWEFFPDTGEFTAVSSPIISADETIYFAVYNALFAINPDGTQKWSFELPYYAGISTASLGPDGTIYFGHRGVVNENYLYALDPTDGTEKWKYNAGAEIRCAPTIGNDGTIYFGTYDGRFLALSPEGELISELDVTGGSYINNSSPALFTDGTIYFGADSPANSIYALNTISNGLADSDWPKFQHDNKNTGMASTISPEEQIAKILEFFDKSVEQGSLVGRGKWPWLANLRLNWLRRMIERAGDFIEWGRIRAACSMLLRAYDRTDGKRWPRDFVTGEAAPELASKIKSLMESLGCE